MLVALALGGCSADALTAGRPSADAGADAFVGNPSDAGGPPPRPTGVESPRGDSYSPTEQACHEMECGAPSCLVTIGSCCEGSVAAECCGEPVATDVFDAVTFADCDASLACIGDAVNGPYLYEHEGVRAIYPGGTTDADGALFIGSSFDSSNVAAHIEVDFATGTECDGCVDAVGVGLVTTAASGAAIEPSIAVLYSSSRRAVRLVVKDRVIVEQPAEGSPNVTLSVRPDGTATLTGVGAPMTAQFPTGPMRLVVFGRSVNPTSGTVGTGVSRVAIGRGTCNVPDAWGPREPITLTGVGNPAPVALPEIRNASIASYGSERWVALETEDGIAIAERGGGGDDELVLRSGDTGYALLANKEDRTFHDPELIYDDARGVLTMFYTRRIGGRTDVGRAVLANGRLTEGDVALLGASEPTIASRPGGHVLIARTASAELSVFELDTIAGTPGEPVTVISTDLLAAAMGLRPDEIANPSLAADEATWLLYFDVRRGTRWSIAMLASDHLSSFRSPTEEGVVLAPIEDFERLGVRGADVLMEADGARMVYVGTDGINDVLAQAFRAGTP